MKLLKRVIPIIILALAAAFIIYTGDYYRADETALEALSQDANVSVAQTDYGWFFDGPSDKEALIFYPGAKVEETAYAPFLRLLAEKGMDVCLVKMPFHLAFFGINKADELMKNYDYASWYIGGHSLGGAMAASYAAENGEKLDGLILCAAYPTEELDDHLQEISLYGSEDKVLNLEKIDEGRAYAPDMYVEHKIEGGNHAQFGNYGEQDGDGTPLVTPAGQQAEAARVIIENCCS